MRLFAINNTILCHERHAGREDEDTLSLQTDLRLQGLEKKGIVIII
jgi:hypothetical protein